MQQENKRHAFGIGVDIESVHRFRRLATNEAFLHRVFTQVELDYCFSHKSPAPHLAARFAAKEAVVKALSGLNKAAPGYKDIEVRNQENGLPIARIHKKGFERLHISLSLSHSRTQAIAFAVIIDTPWNATGGPGSVSRL